MPSRWQKLFAGVGDSPTLRGLVVEANDGIVATAGVVEGFAGAGATGTTVVVAALSAMIAGAIALGGAKYAEEAAERDARVWLIEEEKRQLALSPDEEMHELAAFYEARGLSPGLAEQVAAELTEVDALAAHVEVEHGLSLRQQYLAPLVHGVAAGCAFALGALVPLLAVLLVPDAYRAWATFAAVVVALVITSVIVARTGHTKLGPTALRTLLTGVLAMVLSLAVGALFHP